MLLLSDANSIACLHLHVIGANRAIFSAFFCAIHYARRGWRLFCCGESGDFTTGKAVSVVIMKPLQQMDTSFQISECIHHCVKRRNITIEHTQKSFSTMASFKPILSAVFRNSSPRSLSGNRATFLIVCRLHTFSVSYRKPNP